MIDVSQGRAADAWFLARAAGDGEHRAQFLDPLMDDLRLTLVAHDRYRTATAAQ